MSSLVPHAESQSSSEKEAGENVHAHLSISAHVVVQLGEELVTDVEQALLELAKNAYDADSDSCEVHIEPDWTLSPDDEVYNLLFGDSYDENEEKQPLPVGRVRVRDNGTGLTQDALEKGWLRISASIKRKKSGEAKSKTVRGRTPVGDKGLGRLATMKIGQVLRMKTAVEGENKWRTVTFSWNDFTQDRTLEEVPVLVGEDLTEAVDGTGTIIELIGLHEPERWRDTNYIERHLLPNLSSLINPFLTQDRFTIVLHTAGRTHELHSLDEDTFNLASAKFKFSWDGQSLKQEVQIAPSLFRGLRGEEREERFSDLFGEQNLPVLKEWLQNDKKLTDLGLTFTVGKPWFFGLADQFPGNPFPADPLFPGGIDPGPFKAELYYFMFHQKTQEKLKQAGTDTATLQAMAQVAIFRDGFRVRAQKDWLRISESVTSGSSFYGLRPNNTIGYFSLSNERNLRLIEKSDREGFVDNHAYRGFMVLGLRCRDFADRVLEIARTSVRRFETRDPISEIERPHSPKTLSRQAKETHEKLQSGVHGLQAKLGDTRKALADAREVALLATGAKWGATEVKELQTTVDDAVQRLADVSKALDEIDSQVKHQTRVTSLITQFSEDDREYATRLLEAAAVGLAARSLSHELHQHVRQLRDGISRIHEVNRTIRNQKISEGVRLLTSTTRELTKTVAAIDPLLPGTRSIKETIGVGKFIEEYIDARKGAATRAQVELNWYPDSIGRDIKIHFSRSRFAQVLENLFQNSLYWLKQGPLPDSRIRTIEIRATDTGFSWSDSGPGIRPSLESSIFDAYVSDKPASEGSGLGLHVVSTFLELERCSIQLGTERNPLNRRFRFIVDLLPATAEAKQCQLVN